LNSGGMHRGHHTRILGALVALCLAGAAIAARAQSANCESFRQRVAASIEAKGIQDYSLEFVPRRDPRPAGARAVGNCDGGTYTLLYRRGAAATASARVAEAASLPASQSDEAVAAPPKAARKAAARQAPVAAAAPAPAPAALSASSPAPKTDIARESSPAVVPPAPATPIATVAAAPAAVAPGAAPVQPIERPPSAFDAMARRLAWGVAIVLLAAFVVRQVRRWRHRRYYDEAGLPRGPRITL
jgi:hypothetical protein